MREAGELSFVSKEMFPHKWYMLFQKKENPRKCHHPGGAVRAATTRMHKVSYGGWGLKAVTHGWVSSRQIESAREGISRSLKKGGKMWVRIFPDKPITVKGSE